MVNFVVSEMRGKCKENALVSTEWWTTLPSQEKKVINAGGLSNILFSFQYTPEPSKVMEEKWKENNGFASLEALPLLPSTFGWVHRVNNFAEENLIFHLQFREFSESAESTYQWVLFERSIFVNRQGHGLNLKYFFIPNERKNDKFGEKKISL